MNRILLRALTLSPVSAVFKPLLRGAAPVFMLHRFSDPERGVPGHSAEGLRRCLEYLRRRKYNLVGLEELVNRMRAGEPPLPKSVAFTSDDGYDDFVGVGMPVFAHFDCPVTVFVITGFLDGRQWLWWDRLAFIFRTASASLLTMELERSRTTVSWNNEVERETAFKSLRDKLKTASEVDREGAILRLAGSVGVEMPAQPPPEARPALWQDLIRAADYGVRVGPHSVTHPILPKEHGARVKLEIEESWRRVSQSGVAAVPVFCFPNGDYGSREMDAVRAAGLCAVTSDQAYATRNTLCAADCSRVPRFSFDEDSPQFVRVVSGLGRARHLLRRRTGSG